MRKGKLILKNGITLEGQIFGSEKPSVGEVVFSTGMVGYPESITDPSYRRQILTFTYPLIGNYGVPSEQKNKHGFSNFLESEKIQVKGIVVSEYSLTSSHWTAKKNLSDWLKSAGVPGITGIDTRALTKILRTQGTMPGKIVMEKANEIDFYDPNLTNLVAEVSPNKTKTYKAGQKSIVMIDCGIKNNTIRNFLDRNITVIRVPWNYDFMEAGIKPDGLFISNGPGDPALLEPTIKIIKNFLKLKKPVFGICLGNQLLAHAAGATTYKMKFGNRSHNQPCQDTETERCYMTSQNHGFAIDRKSIPKGWKVWFENINDGTIEGIKHKTLPFSAVQFHPESYPGPMDTEYLFDRFTKQL